MHRIHHRNHAEAALEPPSRRNIAFSRGRVLLLLLMMVTHLIKPLSAQGAPISVRFAEGMVRGFLELSDADGKRIASGDFLQVPRGGELKCRTVLYFKDGSLHDESAVFTQERDFLMKSYRLIQKGKAFEQEMDISLDRSGGGKYRVAVGKAGNEKVLEGKLDLPLDVYNGMVPTVLKNLPKGAREKIHLVAFTPAPRVIELDMVPGGEDRLFIGDLEKSADHYVLKPKLGLLRLPAALLGRTPPDNHIWTITKEVPAFVRFVGPLAFGGPVWRIELASPRWPK